MVTVTQAKIDRFNAIKELMIVELADLENEMDELQQIFNEKMAELGGRRDVLRSALYDEVTPVRVILEEDTTPSGMSTSDLLVSTIRDNPGASNSDLRMLLPELTESGLRQARDFCQQQGLIKNVSESKTRYSWYAV